MLVCFDLPGSWLVLADPQAAGLDRTFAYLVCVPLLHLSVYSVAVMIVCLVRQAIYAGILSMSAMLVLVLLPELPSQHHGVWQMLDTSSILNALSEGASYMHPTWWSIRTVLLVYLTFHAVVVAAATLAAWSSVKYDVAVRG